MSIKPKHIIYSIVKIIIFVVFSVINLLLIVQQSNSDMILLYSIACFFFLYWICGLLFPEKFFQIICKLFLKPMKKSLTMDILGIEVASEKKAYKTYKTMLKIFPYIAYAIIGINIVLLLVL